MSLIGLECYCDACSGRAEPPYEPIPCGEPNPDAPEQVCGLDEDHDGDHGSWFTPSIRPDLPSAS